MTVKRGLLKRSVAGLLAFTMVLGLAAACIPGLVARTAAAETADIPSYHVNNRDKKDGLYIFYPAGSPSLALDIGMDGVENPGQSTVLDYAKVDPSQRFVVQVDENFTNAVTYGIRSVKSAYWLGSATDSDRVVQTANRNYRNDTCRWQFVPQDDGTMLIRHYATGKYFCWSGYGSFNTFKAAPSNGVFTDEYKWSMTQTHMQDEFFTTGIYYLETRLPSTAGVAPADTTLGTPKFVVGIEKSDSSARIEAYQPAAPGTENPDTGEVTWAVEAEPYESQQFVIQKISGGFYSIVNVSTGCYLAVGEDGGIVNGRSSNLAPNPEERWIIYPATQTGNSTVISTGAAADSSSIVSRFRIISAVDGRQITAQQTTNKTQLSGATSALAASPMENYKTQDWLLKDIRLDINNVEKGDTQITDSGVFPDTFDPSSTVSLPIKIFDYAADGMLFEYAANDTPVAYSYYRVGEGKGNFVQNTDGTYTNVGDGNGDYVVFRMGNNMGFSMMSQSNGSLNGGAWDESNGGYYPGNGSNSFGYNKYWCPYISELRLNAAVADNSGLTYEKVILNYVFKAKQPDGYKAASLIDGGTMNTANAGVDLSTSADLQAALGYVMFGEQTFGRATLGLLESGLQTVVSNGKTYTLPRYRSEAVEYIAMVLQRSLEIRYQSADGYLNYNYVDGEVSFADLASGMDLAALLRGDTKANPDVAGGVLEHYNGTNSSPGEDTLTDNFTRYGSYAETLAKSANLIGTWAEVKGNIKTCMDAAYWMLNSIFLEGSYNQPQHRYNSLLLTQVTDQSGKTGYIFDSTFITSSSSQAGSSAVVYDAATGTIRNSSAAGKSYTYWGVNRSAATYPFTPVRTDYQDAQGNVFNGDGTADNPKGYQNQTNTPYILDGGINKSQAGGSEPEYTNANYNFVLQSNAYFVYHENEQLFFDFEGDDDVYLFINGQLVLDIGAAHTVTGTKMNLNDYVYWAREIKADPAAYAALSDAEKARVDALALVEGDTYSFDFYYMERHGWGSNMRIFTNFQLASGQIEAAKSAQQDNKGLSYGSVVDEEKNVEYTFSLKNTGTANLVMPTFSDADIGVTVSYDTGLTVKDGCNGVHVFDKDGGTLEFSDLIFTYQHIGTADAVVTKQFDDLEAMKQWLTHELVIHRYVAGDGSYGLLTVGGIYYALTNEQIAQGAFHNEVVVSAFVRNDGHSLTTDETGGPKNVATGSVLYDSAEFSVFLLSRPLYYHWRDNKLEITVEDILAEVQPAAKDQDNPLSNLVKPTILSITNMRLTDDAGVDTTYPYAFIDPETLNLYADYQTTGIKLVYVTIDYTYETTDESGQLAVKTATATIPVQIFVLDVQASVFVLDYGLKVELSYDDLFENDVLMVDGRNTVTELLGVAAMNSDPVYVSRDTWTEGDKVNSIQFDSLTKDNGLWSIAAQGGYHGSIQVTDDLSDPAVLTYTLQKFLDDRDSIYVAVRVREADHTPNAIGDTDIHNEVEMFKKITLMPANVMYYEDDFAAITYLTDKNVTQSGEHGKSQNSDQDEAYGHDGNAYAPSSDVTMSGGTIAEITLNKEGVVNAAQFSFQGTGFEMISRTNAYDSATVQVKVTDEAGNVKFYPVITQFDHIGTTGDGNADTDEVYQVPVFRITDLPYGTYDVVISGIPTYDFDADFNAFVKETKLYIDGIRIYNPLGTGSVTEYGDQNGAVFTELRGLIFNSKAAAIGLTYDKNGEPIFNTAFGHASFTENLNGWFTSYSGDLKQYAIAGPNNEAYLAEGNAIVLYVKETAAKGLLHIGVHDLHDGDFLGDGSQNLPSAIRYWTAQGWSSEINVGQSGTEQYYPIDYTRCPKVDDYYCVVIQVSDGMVSFTNAKTVGLEYADIEHDEAYQQYRYENGVLEALVGENWVAVELPVTRNLLSLRSVLRSKQQAPEPNPEHGDTDYVWVAVLMGLCSTVCLVSLLRKGVRA